jgi:NDP-sugar pyrophosphorylase family protein
MQALILAAGMGTRLGELTAVSPKCMLRLHGQRLIERLFDGLAGLELRRVIVVVGHGAEELRTALGDALAGLPISYITNPQYRTTNNIYSLALALPALCADDTLLIESDLVLDPAILHACAAGAAPVVAAVATYAPWMDGTVTQVNPDGEITCFLPRGAYDPTAATYYKTVNLYRLDRAFCADCLAPELHAHLERAGPGVYYEEVFGRIVAHGMARMRAVVVDGIDWYEIDTVADLRAAEAIFRPAQPIGRERSG